MSDNDVNAHSGGPAAAPAGGRSSSRRAKLRSAPQNVRHISQDSSLY